MTGEAARGAPPLKRAVLAALVGLSLAYLLAPPAWMLISSFSPDRELMARPPHWIPHDPTHRATTGLSSRLRAPIASCWNGTRRCVRSRARSSTAWSMATGDHAICLTSVRSRPTACRGSSGGGRAGGCCWRLLATRMIPVISILIPIYLVLQVARHAQHALRPRHRVLGPAAALRDLDPRGVLPGVSGRSGGGGGDRRGEPPAAPSSASCCRCPELAVRRRGVRVHLGPGRTSSWG